MIIKVLCTHYPETDPEGFCEWYACEECGVETCTYCGPLHCNCGCE